MKTWLPAFLIAVILALGEGFAGAQQTRKVPRIGYLGLNDPYSSARRTAEIIFESFRQGLREVGYIEGQNIIIERRFAFGDASRLSGLASELVRLQVDVIVVAQSRQVLNAARNATKTIPIVMAFADPVAVAGIVTSPDGLGGNVTGVSGMGMELGGKWLELLKQTAPEVSLVGVLYSRSSERVSPMMKELEVAARSLRVELQPAEVGLAPFVLGSPNFNVDRKVGAALTWATRGQADALIVLPGFDFGENLGYIADASATEARCQHFLEGGLRGGWRPYGLWGKPC